MKYNLLEEKWIPVLYKDGISTRVNIIEAFKDASRIRVIAASNPMDRIAILRFLLALLYWCNRDAPHDKDSLSSFSLDWLKMLQDKKKYFGLFGEKETFYQDRNAGVKLVAAANLLHDLPSGTNIAHFRHLRDFREGLCPACCAMGLLRWASIASAGTAGAGQSMTACINGNTPAYVMRTGATLLETLWLNLPAGKPVEGDAPLWEGATEKSPLGILKGLTWQSRRALLAPGKNSEGHSFSVGNCCYCGDPTNQLVTSILFRPGWQRPSKEPWWDDPHLMRVVAKTDKGKEKRAVPSLGSPDDPLEAHASVWQSLLQGLLQLSDGKPAATAQFQTTLVGASQQLYKDARTHAVTLPPLNHRTVQALAKEEEWLRQLTWRTSSARAIDWHKRPRGQEVIDALCSTAAKGHAIRSSLCAASFLAENKLEQAFAKLTQGLASADPNGPVYGAKVLQEWRREVSRILLQDIQQVADLATRGSALRKREANDRATKAVLSAESRLSTQGEGAKQ